MKSFSTACGLENALQLVVENQRTNEGELRLLHQPFAVIGRDSRSDVVLDHSLVSRRHVYIQIVQGRAFWVDLESRTGTRADNEHRKFGWLDRGRTICVGPYVIRRSLDDFPANEKLARGGRGGDVPLYSRPSGISPLPEVALEFLNGPAQSMSRPVRRVLSLIGSASGCKFRLTDSSVSRFHCTLLQTADGLWIIDLLGQRGISVNDMPLRFSHLADGDVVGIGRYRIRARFRLRGLGTGNVSADLGRRTLVPMFPREDRTANGLKFRNWGAAETPLKPGSEVAKEAQVPMPLQALSDFPRAEVSPAHATFPIELAHSASTGSLLVPLVNQFGQMQQQMFDQFQQAMSVMVQMFGTMHRDQMEVIHTELERLRELTEEFHALKTELANRLPAQAKPASSESAKSTADAAFVSTNDLGTARIASAPPVSGPSPAGIGEQRPSLAPRRAPSPPSSNPRADERAADELPDPLSPNPATPGTARSSADSDRDTVLWLHERIMSLQRERESRWQKILKMLPGMS
jgi:pSer/pThr/pTyr-binding forkhead associated (FHA) protein